MKFVTTILILLTALGAAQADHIPGKSYTPTHTGFFDLAWDTKTGRLYLHINAFDTPFIYQSSLARGVGSNDLGLDRGQLAGTKLVEFYRSGVKVLLIENNVSFRANSDNVNEHRAVQESFARSVLWGFTVESESDTGVVVDATDFFLADSHGLARSLAQSEQGNFSIDKTRSAIFEPRTKSFPDNTEVEAVLTFTGTPKGEILWTVVPDATAITVHTHHSFVRLPDDDYEPLNSDPRSGFINADYWDRFYDYAVPISEPIKQGYARRHRLQKVNANAATSPAVEPIVYYVDRGAPSPIREALIDGARWWNQAFEAAGYEDAFRVELLPQGADPMDVRYNVIQWVHRSTRGWSYGSSVADPRTGEIIKGHVTLGSLRVRQDFLLAEGLLAPYTDNESNPAMEAFALARIRQLSAHEVGHTLGLDHNFAASVNDRASVMDYPFPLIKLSRTGEIDLTDAYGVGIGAWDKRAITWGYQDFPDGTDTTAARERIIKDTYASGLLYVTDVDARSVGTAHAQGAVWDNGDDAVAELEHLMAVRKQVIGNFSQANIKSGRPLATLEEVLVPMYLLHRFQIQAAGKSLGGGYFAYNLKGDGQENFRPVSQRDQRRALNALLNTLTPEALVLPEDLVSQISPRPPGFARDRETFGRVTGSTFDPYAPAGAAIGLTLDVLLDSSRAARLIINENEDAKAIGFGDVLEQLVDMAWSKRLDGHEGEIQRRTRSQLVHRISKLANSESVPGNVRAVAWATLHDLQERLGASDLPRGPHWRAHHLFVSSQLDGLLDEPEGISPLVAPVPPPGSPIGHQNRE